MFLFILLSKSFPSLEILFQIVVTIKIKHARTWKWITRLHFCQAQPSQAKLQLQLRLRLALFLILPTPTHPGKYRNLKFELRQPQWKQTSIEDDLNGRQPQWKTTTMEDNLNGRQPQWKTTSIEDDLNVRQQSSSKQLAHLAQLAKLELSLAQLSLSFLKCLVRDVFFMNVHNPPVPLYHSIKVTPIRIFVDNKSLKASDLPNINT